MPTSDLRRQDAQVIALIALAHGTSHFFHLLLPPLFPQLMSAFGLAWADLGWLVSAFFIVSGIGQAASGFLVDRIGARPVLLTAMLCFAAAAAAAASAQGFGGLLAAAMLAGLGNAPFHPADFHVLNLRVSPARLGPAFAAHGIAGNLGWAAAPVFLIGVASLGGSWRVAFVAAAAWALVVLGVLIAARHLLSGPCSVATSVQGGSGKSVAPAPAASGLGFLRLPAVWLCFAFFFWSTAALSAVQSFAAPALARVHDVALQTSAFVVTGYMLCGALGMAVGGQVVARSASLERTIALAMGAAAAALALAAWPAVGGVLALALVAAAGFGAGLANPSRDMLIRRAAPPGATGRVYGTVYSGLDLGFALAAPVFGWLLDHAGGAAVLLVSAAAMLLAVASATRVRPRHTVAQAVSG